MNDIWAEADKARRKGFAVEDALHGAAKGWVNRAIEAFMDDGLPTDGSDYRQFEFAMRNMSGLELGDALRFAGGGKSIGREAEKLEEGLKRAIELLDDLAERLRGVGRGSVARLAAEKTEAARDALGML